MPTVLTAPPPRLLETSLVVFDTVAAKAAERIGSDERPPEAVVPFVLDLALVESIRAIYDFEGGRMRAEVRIETAGDFYVVAPGALHGRCEAPGVYRYAEGEPDARQAFLAVSVPWHLYRTHADALGRLRN